LIDDEEDDGDNDNEEEEEVFDAEKFFAMFV